MRHIADDTHVAVALPGCDYALEARLWRWMLMAVAVAVVVGAAAAPWRVTTGLILGGSLSLLNYHWLRNSIAAILNVDFASQKPRANASQKPRANASRKPRANASRYFLRYLVVGGIVFAAYNLNLVSLAATVAGLCSFVPALLIEAGRQFYLAIIHREESF